MSRLLKKKRKGAYFIIEVVLFMIFVCFLTVSGLFSSSGLSEEAKASVAKTDTTNIGAAVSHYKYDTGKYPTNLSDLTVAGTDALAGYGPWLPELKKDPWGNNYVLISDTDSFVVYCTEGGKKTNTTANAVDANVIGFLGM